MQAAQKSNLPYVVTFHGGGHSQSWRNGIRNVQLRLLRSLLSRADKLIATAKFEIRDYSKLIDAPANKFVYIANGCDIAIREVKTISQREYPLVISVGRLEKYKGHHRVLAAMPTLIEIQPDVRLRILGEGPYAGELQKMAQDLGVDHRVEIGGVPIERRHEMAETLATATVVTMMSEFETQPMAALEAISLGRPTIVADTSGLSELAEQGWATAIPLNSSPVQVAEAIDRQIKNPMIAKEIRLPTWDDCANQLHDLYYEVIQAR
jgi:glycosyltransferase involved in cell wall biosynthesis